MDELNRSCTPANRIVTSLLAPDRLLFILHYGFCYVEKVNEQGVKELQKHVMRYPQLFATLAVRDTLDAGRRKGVIWHTQGSGKTELSFLLTRYLRDYYSAQNRASRFFFIVDRLSLATQAKEEFEARGAHVSLSTLEKASPRRSRTRAMPRVRSKQTSFLLSQW
jgi:type I restriction enzyme, R subunit